MTHMPLRQCLGWAALTGLATALGCNAAPDTKASATASSKPSAAVAASVDPAVKLYPDADLSVQEDFAAEAAKEINGDNYKAKRDEIAAELTPKPAASDGQGGR